ncbi:MAG: aminopeptidase [Solirubrobacterales bacterium]|nr:aminopeptidase [Solirubrobacterales bacterium]
MEQLDAAVRAVVRDCLAVKAGEQVLVVANPVTEGVGSMLREEAERAGGEAVLALMAERDSHGTEPPAPVAEAMAAADALLLATEQSLSHTEARRRATAGGARCASLPGVNAEMLARVMSADLERLRVRGKAIADAISAASEAHITCANGSDLHIGLEGRDGIEDAGRLAEPGSFGNLPCGESYVAPLEETSWGLLMVDGMIAAVGAVAEPVQLVVEGGHLTAAQGGQGMALMELLTSHGDQATNVAELGIGTNEKARVSGNFLEDEKILGTCHVAFGASAGIGGTVQVPIHLDCIVMKPTIELDGEAILRDGELLV